MELQRFSTELAVNRFDCGHISLNRFLKNKNKAKTAERRLRQRVFVATVGERIDPVAFYALRLGSETAPKPFTSIGFQSVHLSYLGVDLRYQGQGIGRFLLMDAFERVARVSDAAGFDAFTLQSIDASSTAFYESLGFTIYEDGTQPKMLYLLTDLLKLVSPSIE